MKKLLGILCVLALYTCTNDKIAGTIDTTDTGITGKVSYPTGTAAVNAHVQLFNARDTLKTAISQMNTSDSGTFRFESLTPGSYNVWIESSDSLVAFLDSIYVPQHKQVNKDATLGKSGSITAIVGLQTGHDPRSVFVQALGTQKFSNVDSSGLFTIRKLAQGEYTLRLATTIPGYTPTYKTIAVTGGVDSILKDTIKLVYTGIPPVANINADYDPFTGIAKVSWSKTAYANLYDYKIYRDIPGSITLSTVAIAASTDSVFYDTLFNNSTTMPTWGDSSVVNGNIANLAAPVKYRYRVTIRNKSNQEGVPYNFADINGANPLSLMYIVSPPNYAQFTKGTNLSIAWNSLPFVQNYQVAISSKPDFTDSIFAALSKDTIQALPPLSLGNFYVHIRALNSKEQWSPWSFPRMFAVNGGLYVNTFANFIIDNLITTRDGGNLLSGRAYNALDKSNSLHLIKTDSIGNATWQKSYNYAADRQVRAFQADDDGFLISGVYPIFLIKISQNGSIVWAKNENDLSNFNSGTTVSILKTPDKGCLFGKAVFMNSSSMGQTHVLKFNESGVKIWDVTIDSTDVNEPHLLPMGSDDFAVFCLNYKATGADTLIIKTFDYSGNLKISKRIYIGEAQFIRSVCKTTSGDILVGINALADMNCSIIKINTDWVSVKSRTTSYLLGIEAMPDGGYIQCSYGMDNVAGNVTKKDKSGITIWTNTIPFIDHYYFSSNSDGSVVVAHTPISTSTVYEVQLFKISKDGVSFEK